MDQVECTVIGGGVIGLAVARALAMAGREVIILERDGDIGGGISSRNSEVIHAGLYYPWNTLKARFCVAGRDQLYAYCSARNVPHRRCGKFVVATNAEQAGQLERIATAARRNGVSDVEQLAGADAIKAEPELKCVSALNSPSTGIIDSHTFMLSLLGDAEAHGAAIAFHTAVAGMRLRADDVEITLQGDDEPALKARLVVNAAGLGAAPLTHQIDGFDKAFARPSFYAKGSYFTLAGRAPFSRLVYPAPEPGGLGVHLTLDLAGQARFGPDVEWIGAPHYDVDEKRADKFYAAVRAYWPGLRDGALKPAYSGIRPKVTGPDQPAADFAIEGAAIHGARGIINLLGIESPGLTSSLAIADHVAALAAEQLDA